MILQILFHQRHYRLIIIKPLRMSFYLSKGMFQASSPKYSSHRKMQKGFACFEGLRLEFCGIQNLIYRRESVRTNAACPPSQARSRCLIYWNFGICFRHVICVSGILALGNCGNLMPANDFLSFTKRSLPMMH